MRVVVTGTTGYLGRYVVAALERLGCEVTTAGRRDSKVIVDLAETDTIASAIEPIDPDILVNVAAESSIAACARDPERADRVNARAVAVLASLPGSRLVQISTDLVFDGRGAPYLASAAPRPLSAYGRSKLAGELAALTSPRALVVRLPLLFGPSHDGAHGATDMLRPGRALTLYTNEHRTPLHVGDAARALAELALDQEHVGVVHVAGPERISRWGLAQRYAAIHGLDSSSWSPGVSTATDRPRDTAMFTDWSSGRSLDEALAAS